MTDQKQSTWTDWIGATVVDRDGDKIGSLDQIFVDDRSGQPEWMAVTTGLFGTKQTVVPLQGADAAGQDLQVPFDKAHVKDAPSVDAEDGHLDPDEESRLYEHYGRSDYDTTTDDGGRSGDQQRGQSGRGTGTPDTGGDTSVTRSEEELEVGTHAEERGRVRLRKWVETEQVTTTIPVRKEKVRLEREPVDGDIGDVEISEADQEIVVKEEVPVVGKKTVAKEKVGLKKETEVVDEEVGGEVRKERVEVEGDPDA